MSPTARSLAHLKELGYVSQIVEHWNPFSRTRKDLFGADILCLKSGEPVLAIQATSGANHSARRVKLQAGEFIDLWKQSGVTLEIWSWQKRGQRGKRKTWQLKRETL